MLFKNRVWKYLRKSFAPCRTHLARGVLLEALKHFEVMLSILSPLAGKKEAESWLVYGNKFSRVTQLYFLARNKTCFCFFI